MTISTFLRSTIAVGPNRSRMLMIPSPRISMWCRVTSSPVPRMVIRIEDWNADKDYDRLGLEGLRTDLLGVGLPTVLIPVSPARNLASIVEVAVRNYLLKRQGVFYAAALVERKWKLGEGGKPE